MYIPGITNWAKKVTRRKEESDENMEIRMRAFFELILKQTKEKNYKIQQFVIKLEISNLKEKS